MPAVGDRLIVEWNDNEAFDCTVRRQTNDPDWYSLQFDDGRFVVRLHGVDARPWSYRLEDQASDFEAADEVATLEESTTAHIGPARSLFCTAVSSHAVLT